jgi:hypothetical protein
VGYLGHCSPTGVCSFIGASVEAVFHDIWSLSGTYYIEQETSSRCRRLVSAQESCSLGIIKHGSEEKMQDFIQASPTYNATELPTGGKSVNHDPWLQLLTIKTTLFRGMVSLAFLFLDIQCWQANFGISCRECEDEYLRWSKSGERDAWSHDTLLALVRKWDKAYFEEEFIKPFQDCTGAQRLLNFGAESNHV